MNKTAFSLLKSVNLRSYSSSEVIYFSRTNITHDYRKKDKIKKLILIKAEFLFKLY